MFTSFLDFLFDFLLAPPVLNNDPKNPDVFLGISVIEYSWSNVYAIWFALLLISGVLNPHKPVVSNTYLGYCELGLEYCGSGYCKIGLEFCRFEFSVGTKRYF